MANVKKRNVIHAVGGSVYFVRGYQSPLGYDLRVDANTATKEDMREALKKNFSPDVGFSDEFIDHALSKVLDHEVQGEILTVDQLIDRTTWGGQNAAGTLHMIFVDGNVTNLGVFDANLQQGKFPVTMDVLQHIAKDHVVQIDWSDEESGSIVS